MKTRRAYARYLREQGYYGSLIDSLEKEPDLQARPVRPPKLADNAEQFHSSIDRAVGFLLLAVVLAAAIAITLALVFS